MALGRLRFSENWSYLICLQPFYLSQCLDGLFFILLIVCIFKFLCPFLFSIYVTRYSAPVASNAQRVLAFLLATATEAFMLPRDFCFSSAHTLRRSVFPGATL